MKIGKELGNYDPEKNNEPKEDNEKHHLDKKRNDIGLEIEESNDENNAHDAENISQHTSGSTGERTSGVRVTK